CSLPLFDTLKVTVNVEPPPNNEPYFVTPDVSDVLAEGTSKSWSIEARDDDGDPLSIRFVPVGFVAEDVGMNFTIQEQQNGLVKATLSWDALCDVYDFDARTDFEVLVVAEDADYCNLRNAATMRFDLKVLLPPDELPIIDTDLTPDPAERLVPEVKRQVFERSEEHTSELQSR